MSKIILDNDNNNAAIMNNENNFSFQDDGIEKRVFDEFKIAFPEWDLVPPSQVVKRVRRSL